MKVLVSECCQADLTLRSDLEFVWAECEECGQKYSKLTHTELIDKVQKFINGEDEKEEDEEDCPIHGKLGGINECPRC